jgi:SAM-dependent methyltransferase
MDADNPNPAPAPFEPGRFASTVPAYVAFRPRYPDRLLSLVLADLDLGHPAQVLDLGCGPGFLANGFAALGCGAVGIDPNADMLAAARGEAAKHGVVVDYRLGSSYDLDHLQGRFDLVAMGRSFHWMDRPQTLASLDRLVSPRGAVAIFYDWHMRCTENAFDGVLSRMRERFSGDAIRLKLKKSNIVKPDESVMLDSTFSQLVRIGIVERRPLTADQIVGRAFSLSATSPEKLGDRIAAFEAELRARLAELQPDGRFTELIEFVALIARRPTV